MAQVCLKEGPAGSSFKVHIVEDDDAVRDALVMLLGSADFRTTAHASGQEFLEWQDKVATDDVGCVLLDLKMPGLNGIEVLRRLRERGFQRPVIAMSAYGDIAIAVQAMKAGADDFLVKPFDDEQLLTMINTALGQYADPAENGAGVTASQRRLYDAARRVAELSPREREVLTLLAAGKPNKLIASELGISHRTAEIHRARMMARLRVRSLAEAIRLMIDAERIAPYGGIFHMDSLPGTVRSAQAS